MAAPDAFEELKNSYLEDSDRVGIYYKSKKYSKLGVWVTLISWYITLAIYMQSGSGSRLNFYAAAFISALVTIVTLLLLVNARRVQIDDKTVMSHDIASLIQSYEQGGSEGLLKRYNQIDGRISDNGVLSAKRRNELANLIDEIDAEDDYVDEDVIEFNLQIIAADAIRVLDTDLEIPKGESESEAGFETDEPGFLRVVLSSMDSENVNSTYVFWSVFVLTAVLGTVVALWKGQAWGVLIVTILFGALKFHDNRSH